MCCPDTVANLRVYRRGGGNHGGRQVLDDLMSQRRLRTGPRVVKRAISNYVAKTAAGRIRAPSRKATINITINRVDP